MKKPADAERWARVAEAVLARIGGDDDLAVRLDVERADRASLERALATQIRARGEGTVRAGEILYMIAMEHELGNRPDDAAAARARADAVFKTVSGAVGTGYAPLLSKEMQALAAGEFEQAIAYGEAGMAAMARVHPTDHPLYAEGISALSYAYEAADRYEEALRLKRRAIAILEEAGEDKGLLATVVHDAGSVENRLGRHAAARADFERALALVEAGAADDDPLPAMCRSGLGEALIGLGREREAIAPLERALAWREAHAESIPAVQLGATRFALARARWAEGDRARALEGARAARGAFAAHRDRFAGQPGWAKKAVKVAEGKIADVDRWLGERERATR
jgi:tetratricopeptide (TPR) repeat protein